MSSTDQRHELGLRKHRHPWETKIFRNLRTQEQLCTERLQLVDEEFPIALLKEWMNLERPTILRVVACVGSKTHSLLVKSEHSFIFEKV